MIAPRFQPGFPFATYRLWRGTQWAVWRTLPRVWDFEVVGEKALISGDLIFQGSIGRTDFPGCDQNDMQKSLERIKEFDDDVRLFPGHMGDTTVGIEKKTNPFLK